MTFRNREEAGRGLAAYLQRYRDHPTAVILALPRGGVAVGYQLSLALRLPLDVFITRKIGAPDNPEYALGALSETGNLYLNPEVMADFPLSKQEMEDLVRAQREEIGRRQRLYRQGRHPRILKDCFVVLVDDGLATGATFIASAEAIKRQAPRSLVAAIPVGPMETIQKAGAVVDELVVLATPDPFWSVGSHYAEFTQVGDEEVVKYLNLADAAHDEWEVKRRGLGVRR